MRIQVTPRISIDDKDIQEEFVRSPGPGGQNVNKVSTAVRLRFDAAHSTSLPDDVRQRLAAISGKRLTDDGVLVISASRFRTQEKNRLDAMERLTGLIRRAATPPKSRRRTRPTLASRLERLESKARRARVKRQRARHDLRE